MGSGLLVSALNKTVPLVRFWAFPGPGLFDKQTPSPQLRKPPSLAVPTSLGL